MPRDNSLTTAARTLAPYLDYLEKIITRRDVTAPAAATMRLAPGSSAPWNTAVADVVLGAHADIRRLEAELRARAGLPQRPRGGADTATSRALTLLGALAEAAGDDVARDKARILQHWIRGAQRLPAIDELTRWVAIRRECDDPGCRYQAHAGHTHALRCGYCGTPNLRAAPAPGMVRCFNPGCTDDDGAQPAGLLEPNRLNGEPQLVWSDGRVQLTL